MLRAPYARYLILVATLAAGAAGCSSSSNSGSGQGGGNGVQPTGATGSGAAGSGNGANAGNTSASGGIASSTGGAGTGAASSTGGTTSTGTACHGVAYTPDAGGGQGGICAGIQAETESSKIDMYIMMDRTQSMEQPTQCDTNDVCISTRWKDLKAAVQTYVGINQDVRVGLQFFNHTGSSNQPTVDCDPTMYSTPAVEIGDVATTGPQIVTALDAIVLGGQTPSVPALQGAITHARAWQVQNPTRQTVVLLVTDGLATQCDTSATVFAQTATDGMSGDPPIRTYVVGVSVGLNHFTMDSVAAAGGSTKAFLVEDTNTTQGLIDALATVTSNPLKCEYSVPPKPDPLHDLSYDLVQVIHTPATGPDEEVPYAKNRGGCGTQHGGWYYDVQPPPPDDTTSPRPSKIIMCPCTCASLNVGKLQIMYGCHPTVSGLG
jgi:hypothetical protein